MDGIPSTLAYMPSEMTVIADMVRGVAAKHRANQTNIATILGIQRAAVSQRMNGKVPFTAPEVFQLATVFNENITAFFPAPVASSPSPDDTAGVFAAPTS